MFIVEELGKGLPEGLVSLGMMAGYHGPLE